MTDIERHLSRLAQSIPVDDVLKGMVRNITELRDALAVLTNQPDSIELAVALHRLSLAINTLHTQIYNSRDRLLVRLKETMSNGALATQLGMRRTNLVSLLTRKRAPAQTKT